MTTTPIAVVGPTATGKTQLGVLLAQHLNSQVISIDSQLVYRGLDIGVAKPTVLEMQGIPHHMMSIVKPTQAFSAGDFALQARPILHQLQQQGHRPILVGGTGFYLRALLQQQHLPTVPANDALRAELNQRLQQEGAEALYAELQRLDPRRAAQLHPNNTIRVRRALEIVLQTGQPVPETPTEITQPFVAIGLTYANRQRHIEAIETRLHRMVKNGFLQEVEQLYQQYGACFALQNAHGYPELIQVLQQQRTLEDALAQIAINIRQYSKRQMTWFKKLPNIQWYAVDELPWDAIASAAIQQIN